MELQVTPAPGRNKFLQIQNDVTRDKLHLDDTATGDGCVYLQNIRLPHPYHAIFESYIQKKGTCTNPRTTIPNATIPRMTIPKATIPRTTILRTDQS
jgi:hypothetical protein